MKIVNDFVNYYASSLTDGDIQTIGKAELDKSIELKTELSASEKQHALAKLFKDHTKKDKQEFLSVCLAPFFIVPTVKRGEAISRDRVYPFWIPALVNKEGVLCVPKNEELPWFSRAVLEPYIPSKFDIPTISHVQVVDQKLAKYTVVKTNWLAYWQNCEDFFKAITNVNFLNFEIEHFDVVPHTTVVINKPPSATHHIAALYKDIKNTPQKPSLLHTVFTTLSEEQKVVAHQASLFLNAGHYGQFNNQFPLSFSQRQSIHYFIQDQKETEASVLAVNGPPGTGKTTLLQSIIANEMVRHVLEHKKAPKIIASSTNNQAITNILDSFENNNSLNRWLPHVHSLGTYLTNTEKPNASYQIIDKGNKGFTGGYFEQLEQANTFDLKEYYLDQYNAYFIDQPQTTIQKCLEELQVRIEENKDTLDAILASYQKGAAFEAKHFPLATVALHKSNLSLLAQEITRLETEYESLKSFYKNDFQPFFVQPKTSLVDRIFSKTKEKTAQDITAYFATCSVAILNSCTSYEEAQRIIIASLNEYKEEIKLKKQVKTSLTMLDTEAQTHLEAIQQSESKVEQLWQDYLADKTVEQVAFYNNMLDKMEVYERINVIADLTLRYASFFYAIHYWEAKWLLLKEESKFKNGSGKKAVQAMYERASHLTPLFVSTLYSLPKYCRYAKYKEDNTYEQLFHYNLFDMLLVDEAGQVTPEVGLPAFCFSKRALVVGDIYQIEPIWRIHHSRIDQANLQEAGVLNHYNYATVKEKNIVAVSGSLMHLAQQASRVKLSTGLGGTMLTEHRRCVNNLVAYCNEYIYQGLLQPLVGDLESNVFEDQNDSLTIPPFAYINIAGKSNKATGSLQNEEEAKAIVKWIAAYEKHLVNFYSTAESTKTIDQILAVVTPFTGQKNKIKQLLKEYELSENIIVGTVHALQGSEKPMVLFSPTYGTNHTKGNYFFDNGYNMLNVAITRAKHHFIVIGNLRNFQVGNAGLPSNGLANYLYKNPENELSSSYLFDYIPSESKLRVSTLLKHQKCISKVLSEAQKRVVFVSPFISKYAIEHDDITQKIRDFKTRLPQGQVLIYTDSDLDKHNGTLKESAQEGRQLLIEAGAELIILKGIHNKALVKDEDILIEGSFNWLSAMRNKANKHYRHEVSQIIMHEEATMQIRELFEELNTIEIGN